MFVLAKLFVVKYCIDVTKFNVATALGRIG